MRTALPLVGFCLVLLAALHAAKEAPARLWVRLQDERGADRAHLAGQRKLPDRSAGLGREASRRRSRTPAKSQRPGRDPVLRVDEAHLHALAVGLPHRPESHERFGIETIATKHS